MVLTSGALGPPAAAGTPPNAALAAATASVLRPPGGITTRGGAAAPAAHAALLDPITWSFFWRRNTWSQQSLQYQRPLPSSTAPSIAVPRHSEQVWTVTPLAAAAWAGAIAESPPGGTAPRATGTGAASLDMSGDMTRLIFVGDVHWPAPLTPCLWPPWLPEAPSAGAPFASSSSARRMASRKSRSACAVSGSSAAWPESACNPGAVRTNGGMPGRGGNPRRAACALSWTCACMSSNSSARLSACSTVIYMPTRRSLEAP
mmetsp:Transcript_106241/g.298795  ORF Transcript_106241/g.298795 Transcript_106241/m.298795 type:complete len:260 (+) Transcript_106241:1370-2149(+)